MAITFNDNIKVSANKPIDFKFGPFESVTQANTLIPESQRYHGLIFGVYTEPLDLSNSDIEFYYYWDDLSDASYKRLLLEQNFLDAINLSQNASALNPFATVEQLNTSSGGGNIVLFGGIPQWSGTGLIFDAPYTGFIVDGTYYEDGPEQITLTTADPTDPRRDRFILSSSGWGFLTGTPSAIPVAEQINTITEIDRGDVLIGAGATTPTVTDENVYIDNTQWATSSGGSGTFNPNSTNAPFSDTVSFEATNVSTGGYMLFTRGSDYDMSNTDSVGMQVRLKFALRNGRSLRIQFLNNSDVPVSQSVILPIVNSNNTGYQFTSLDKASLGLTSNLVRKLKITYSGTGGPAVYGGYFIDDVIIQSGVGVTPVGDGVQSVTGDGVDNTDPDNPVISFPTPAEIGAVESVTGDGVDNTDPANPVITQPTVEPVQDVFTWTTGPQEFTLSEANVGLPIVFLNTAHLRESMWTLTAGVLTITETIPNPSLVVVWYFKTALVGGYPEYGFSAGQFYMIGGTVFRLGGYVAQDVSGGITLTFRKDTGYGTPAVPLSGAISEDFTGDNAPNVGAKATLWYSDTALPLDSKYIPAPGDTFDNTKLNQITFTYFANDYITYSIALFDLI